MAKRKVKRNSIPLKNYLITIVLMAACIFLVIYALKWYEVKRIEKYGTSYLIKTKTVNMEISDYEEIEQVFMEAPSDYYILINYLNDKNSYKLETNLKNIIDNYDLNDLFYYINVTELKENDDNYLEKLNKTLKIDNEIKTVPVILFYHNGKLAEKIYSANDFKKILQVYQVES